MWINGNGGSDLKGYLIFAAKSFLRMLLLLLAVSAVTFALVSASPIDPLQQNVGQAALGTMSQEQREKLETYWGMDTPPVERYLNWLGAFLKGDMGTSLLYRRPVWEVIGEKLANSLLLMAVSWLLSGLLGLLLGIVAGAFAGKWPDRLINGYSLLISSTPVFWLALLLLLVFAVWLKMFPIGLSVPIGMEASSVTWADRLYHAVLPAVALSVTGTANITLHTRQKMLEVLSSDYMLYARARGESRWTAIRRHGLRNILLPAMTLQFASVSEIIGGSVMVEQVFSYPGLGQAAVTAGLGSDVPLLMGIVIATAGIVFLGNWIADLLYRAVDPRMRAERRQP
jgi:peptide/nickel transport system permease protein